MKIKSILFVLVAASAFQMSCSRKSVPVSASNTVVKEKEVSTVQPNTSTLTEDLAKGKQIYESSCGRCHGLKNTKDYTRSEWNGIMNVMAGKARLNPTQKNQVMTYVTQNAK